MSHPTVLCYALHLNKSLTPLSRFQISVISDYHVYAIGRDFEGKLKRFYYPRKVLQLLPDQSVSEWCRQSVCVKSSEFLHDGSDPSSTDFVLFFIFYGFLFILCCFSCAGFLCDSTVMVYRFKWKWVHVLIHLIFQHLQITTVAP
ncbi:hypothetical protein L2E82_20797 [Cichorium intybus]|uniref:Uncharacterized protein n=1 Tax=Cichorium intybus TaxID=13427 RepID=A0ACB9DUP1_CICIN|nr:hypothetical protein L2E82_20797 [Cichorium intybus]